MRPAVLLLAALLAGAGEKPKSFDVFDEDEAVEDTEEETVEATKPAPPKPEPPPPPAKADAPKPDAPKAEPPKAEPPKARQVDLRKVMVLVVPNTPAEMSLALRLADVATKKLAEARGLTPVTLRAAADPGGAEMDEISEGLESARRGIQAVEALDLDAAGTELDVALNALLAHVERLSESQRAVLEDALFALGATSLFQNQKEDALRVFVALLLLSPEYQPPRKGYPANVHARWKELKASLDRRPSGAIVVRTTPPGATVHIDGVFRGASPVTVQGLKDGQHVVVAERLGYRPFGTLAIVTGGRSSAVEADLEATGAKRLLEELKPELAASPELAAALGKKLGVGHLAVFEIGRAYGGLRSSGLWLAVEEGRVIAKIATVGVTEDPEAAAATLIEALDAAEAAAPKPAPPPPIAVAPPAPEVSAPAPSGEPWSPPEVLDEWWFWAIVGGVAVVAAGTTAVVAADRGGHPSGSNLFGF